MSTWKVSCAVTVDARDLDVTVDDSPEVGCELKGNVQADDVEWLESCRPALSEVPLALPSAGLSVDEEKLQTVDA
jgi:hypothetical protein